MNCKNIFLSGAAFALLVALGDRVSASPITLSSSFSTSLEIPDNDPTGVADTQVLSMPGANRILSLTVSLEIDGGFNGDFYAYLRHGISGFAVLLNRVGLSGTNPFGYADSGLNVTLSDTAPDGDIHSYQTLINPNGGSLTGQWQPDGRNIDPAVVSDSALRTSLLSGFNGLDPNGAWTLFVSDNSALSIGTLRSWGLTVTADIAPTVGVPEGCGTVGLLMLASAAVLAPSMRRRKRSD
jgi:subtilisin-like proprotein convertase family protein